MVKWKYTIQFVVRENSVVKELNSFGEEGWELVTERRDDSGNTILTFKRELT